MTFARHALLCFFFAQGKLDTLASEQAAGKTLADGQREALAKLPEVIIETDTLRELLKTISTMQKDEMKAIKAQKEKERRALHDDAIGRYARALRLVRLAERVHERNADAQANRVNLLSHLSCPPARRR